MGKIFNKGVSEDDKKEWVLKGLKNIEDTNKANKVKNKDIIEVTDFVDQPLSSKAKELINEIKTIQKNVDYRKLKLEVVTMLILILVIIKHLKNYLEIFITKKYNRLCRKKARWNYWSNGCFKSLCSKR